jgi:hypothetical protein
VEVAALGPGVHVSQEIRGSGVIRAHSAGWQPGLVRRMAPTAARESGKSTITRNPLAAGLDGQCGEIGVGYEIALGRRAAAQ